MLIGLHNWLNANSDTGYFISEYIIDEYLKANHPTIKPIEPKYKCSDCGAEMNEGEASTFTVCDDCWEKAYPKKTKPIVSNEEIEKYATEFYGDAKIFSDTNACIKGAKWMRDYKLNK